MVDPLPYPIPSPCLGIAPVYEMLRRERPVCPVTMPDGRRGWLVTRYADARAVYLDTETFSREAAEGLSGYPPLTGFLISMEGAGHNRVRSALAGAFTVRRAEALRPRVREICAGLLDDMARQGPPADLVEAVTLPLPVTVISEVFGVPEEDRAAFGAWGDALLSFGGKGAEGARAHLADYVAGLVADRRKHPGDDLFSTIIACGADFTDEELVVRGIEILISGFETTVTQAGTCTFYLLSHPDRLDHLRAHPEKVPAAVDELLRLIPVGSADSLPRLATRDTELAGVRIRAGEAVLISHASADRDETVYPEPETANFDRDDNPHLAFGYGPHRCLGAPLARVELQEYLRGLVERFPTLRLAVPAEEVRWRPDSMLRSLEALPVAW